MSWVISALGLIIDLWDWFRDRGQQQIGAQKQVISDDATTIKAQQAELQAAVDRPTDKQLSDELQHGQF